MLTICKLRLDPVVDFAAVELKKYLRMMMPECGDIGIRYAPDAKDGFRLGLLADFGLETPGDPVLDDTLHIDTNETGGVIAGSNSRSVLLAVYRFLTENGCRWLYPGVDGEHIPVRNIAPVRFHKTADYRFRGFCNEGCESQACMLETIDFFPKIGLNVYMMEFDTPFFYYDRYYRHVGNQKVRPPEPVTKQQVKQWKRMCETEIQRRGLQFHDMGHGWTAEPFGFDSSSGWHREAQDIPEESRRYLAEIGGKREFFRGVPLLTNVCMSNPEVRTIMAKGIADYAESHRNVDFLHVWLADDARNHCECAECRKMRPSDWYMMIMNELDELLTARGLDTRIVFISYVDTLWGPEKVRIQNPERFSLLVAHATRGQMAALPDKTTIRSELPYVRNAWKAPETAEENLGLIQGWKKLWQGPVFSYEYHFFMEQYYDPGAMAASRKLYDDLHGLRDIGIDGFVEDASQRCFFPNGLSVYTFAQTLFDQSLPYEAIRDDYLRHAYGADWEQAQAWLQRLSDAFDFDYLQGLRSEDPVKDRYFAPSRVKGLQSIADLAAQGKALAAAHGTNPTRPQAVSWRLLQLLTEYSAALSDALAKKAGGRDREARAAFETFLETFGRHEFEIERYFDQGLMWETYTRVFSVPENKAEVVEV